MEQYDPAEDIDSNKQRRISKEFNDIFHIDTEHDVDEQIKMITSKLEEDNDSDDDEQ